MQTGPLPSTQHAPKRIRRPILALLVHSARVIVVIALLALIPQPAPQIDPADRMSPEIGQFQSALPMAVSIEDPNDETGLWTLFDETGKLLGTVARTLPAAESIVGYRGPTEAVILFDPQMTILSVRLLQSADTDEHVEAIINDPSFFKQFEGWPWGGPSRSTKIDGVSGATLTSMALAEGVLTRIGGNRPSLLFPNSLTPDEVRDWFDHADKVDDTAAVAIVKNRDGKPIGRVFRTGPFSDDITGYRGPTELLMKLDDHDRVEQIRLRSSYETDPFLDSIRDEAGFLAIFQQKTLAELAEFDPAAAGVEGVSGATMTSMAVADTIVEAASTARNQTSADSATATGPERWLGFRWSSTDFATFTLLLLAGFASRWHRFRHRGFRKIWLAVVIVVIGFWSGNLLSLALLVGWSSAGAAWQLAPGLAGLAAVAILAPPIRGRNPYCNHLCPHGAVQQGIRPTRKSALRVHPSRAQSRWLGRIPGATLIAAYLAVVTIPNIDLSSWEPFHAYLLKFSGWGAMVIAVVSLVVARVVPMGYCRFGCPTGSLLDYLRRTATSDRLRFADAIAIGLLLFALGLRRW